MNSGAIAGSKKHRRVTKSGRAMMEKESSRVGVATQNTVDEELRDSRKSDAGTAFFEISEKCEELRQVSAEMSSDKNPDARGLSSGLRSVVSAPSSVAVKLEAGVAGSSTQGFEKNLVAALPAPPDVLLLYWTLVRDGVLPKGYELEFASLESAIRNGAARALKRTAGSDNQSAAVWLHWRQQESASKARSEKLAVDQLLLSSSERPSKFRAKWQEKFFDGPTARKDAEEAPRTKWIRELEGLLQGTATPMAKVLEERKGDSNVLGGGRRASTLRARVRAAKKYLSWLAVSADVAFPTQVVHLTGFLETRHSEPCSRGALKSAHQSMVFLEDVAGIEERLTTNALYTVEYKELLSTAQPGGVPKQAPRYPAAVLESLESLVVDESAVFFIWGCTPGGFWSSPGEL